MSPDRDTMLRLILEEVPTALPDVPKEEVTSSTFLAGKDSPFDSLALVSLLVQMEERIYRDYKAGITLSNFLEESDDRSIGGLADYALGVLQAALPAAR